MRKAQYTRCLLQVLSLVRGALGLGSKNTFDTAMILGTGWGDHLEIKTLASVPLTEISGFEELDELEGHERRIEVAEVRASDDPDAQVKRILVLRGRIHMNEDTFNPAVRQMVRMQYDLLFELGVKMLILTCSAGALDPDLMDGDIIAIDKLPSFGSGEIMPLFPGEFVNAESALDPRWLSDVRTSTFIQNTGVRFVPGGYMFFRGPHFETVEDKADMLERGAISVGMSMKPGCTVAALREDVSVIALGFISNRLDEIPSHDLHRARAKQYASRLSRALELAIWY